MPPNNEDVKEQGDSPRALFTLLPKETVWKIETGPIVKPLGRADRDQQALFHGLVSPETTFNEPSSYFPDSF